MKTDNSAGNSRENDTSGNVRHSNNYNNEIDTGSVGFEGDGNNGASTLRVLKKKHADDVPAKKARRPIL